MAASFTSLTAAALKTCVKENLSLYESVVPAKLTKLDDFRYNFRPSKGEDDSSTLVLHKDDLVSLVDWKLSHGTFRPSLKKLVDSNSEETVTDATREAFSLIPDGTPTEHDVKASLAVLTKLRGIGPATASLMLSVLRPDEIPFFSDELFRWAMWEEGKGKGWDRGIKYSIKEYLELFGRVKDVLEQTGGEVKAVELEKVAYVLARSTDGKASSTKRPASDEYSGEAKPEMRGTKKAKTEIATTTKATRSSVRKKRESA